MNLSQFGAVGFLFLRRGSLLAKFPRFSVFSYLVRI